MRSIAGLALLVAVSAAFARAGDDAPAPPAVPPTVPTVAQYEGRSAAEWTADLASEDVKLRQKAAYALFKLGPDAKTAATALVKAVRDADPYVRTTSAKAVSNLGADAAKPVVAEIATMLVDERQDVRRESASLLWRLGPLAADVVPELTKALASEDEIVRANAAGCLGNAGAAAKPALADVVKALDDADENVRKWATKALVAIDPVASFGSERTAVRLAATQAYAEPSLQGWTKPEIVACVLKAIDDRDEEVRGWAAHALDSYAAFSGANAPVEWIPVFRKVLTTSRTPGARANAAYGLGRYKGRGSESVPLLIDAAKSREPEVQRAAVLALGWLGEEARASVPVVLEALGAADVETRSAAAVALGSLGDASEPVIEGLVGCLEEEQGFAARNAIRSLGVLGRDSRRVAAAFADLLLGGRADAYVCGDAVGAVKAAGLSESVLAALKPALAKEPRERPAVAFAVCALDPAADPKEIGALVFLVQVDPPDTRALAFLRLLGPKGAPAVPALTNLLSHADPRTRISAAVALGAIGPGAKDAIPALERMTKDPDSMAVTAAKQAIEQIRAAPEPTK